MRNHIRIPFAPGLFAVIALTGMAVSGPAIADKPEWAGGGKQESRHREQSKQDRHEARDDYRKNERHDGREAHRRERHAKDARAYGGHGYFDDYQREVVHEYYTRSFRSGRCPPGLAKKHNGCLPPGQARKWEMGRPLPREVVYYDLPPSIVINLGPPPSGHKYVRIASDILLIAIGTGMVVDAIHDLDRM